MSVKKGIYPCIWLLNGKAVKGFDNNETVSEDPAKLVRSYAASGADGVILFDRSKTDAEHDAAIDLIRRICEEGGVPVIGAGNVRRMEDVKKLIYAGCEMAALNLSKESNRLLAREVCERFGKERIAGCYRTGEKLDREWDKLSPWMAMRILLDADRAKSAEDFQSSKTGCARCGGDLRLWRQQSCGRRRGCRQGCTRPLRSLWDRDGGAQKGSFYLG